MEMLNFPFTDPKENCYCTTAREDNFSFVLKTAISRTVVGKMVHAGETRRALWVVLLSVAVFIDSGISGKSQKWHATPCSLFIYLFIYYNLWIKKRNPKDELQRSPRPDIKTDHLKNIYKQKKKKRRKRSRKYRMFLYENTVCFRVLKESNKSTSNIYSVKNVSGLPRALYSDRQPFSK